MLLVNERKARDLRGSEMALHSQSIRDERKSIRETRRKLAAQGMQTSNNRSMCNHNNSGIRPDDDKMGWFLNYTNTQA